MPRCAVRETMADETGNEVLLEFHRVGNAVKVTAVDPEIGTEVSIVGDPSAGEEILTRIAIKKLQYVLRKRGIDGSS